MEAGKTQDYSMAVLDTGGVKKKPGLVVKKENVIHGRYYHHDISFES